MERKRKGEVVFLLFVFLLFSYVGLSFTWI